jgi:beta-propeller repeat-containing protein
VANRVAAAVRVHRSQWTLLVIVVIVATAFPGRLRGAPSLPGAVTDPVVVFSTYLGGSDTENGGGNGGGGSQMVAIGPDGSAYVAGTTLSLDFLTTPGALQRTPGPVFVAKLSPTGAVVYSTYLGGIGGGFTTGFATGIAVDRSGSAYVTGFADSDDFPGTRERSATVFVAKLDPTGSSLLYSGRFGAHGDNSSAIAVDSGGNAYVTGRTLGAEASGLVFATPGAYQTVCGGCSGGNLTGVSDAFVLKLDATGRMVYRTYLGGRGGDIGTGIAVDGSGRAFVTGMTTSDDFPTKNAFQSVYGSPDERGKAGDAFVTALNTSGSDVLYSTYLGGSGEENRNSPGDIAVDGAGNAYVTGYTQSPDFPGTVGAFQPTFPVFPNTPYPGVSKAFVTKFDATGSVVYSTYLGGAGDEQASSIAVDSAGRAYVAGTTFSPNFPITDSLLGGSSPDAFVAILDPAGAGLDFSTFLGLPQSNSLRLASVPQGIALDSTGDVIVVGVTTGPFPTVNAEQPIHTGPFGSTDMFAMRIALAGSDTAPPTVQCGTADGLWHASDVSIACTTSDAGSGLANPADAAFSLLTSVAAQTENANASTGSRRVCDVAGNCATADPIAGNMVDKKAPSITITSPTSATYLLGASEIADYKCADAGSGVTNCSGPVPSGSGIDTATVGAKPFSVSASDLVGNAASLQVPYAVTYDVCALYDATKAYKGGSTIPIRLRLCDASGRNVSSPEIVVVAQNLSLVSTATSALVMDAGNANPDDRFRYDSGEYIFNLKTTGLATGTYALALTVTGDPAAHTVLFQVK